MYQKGTVSARLKKKLVTLASSNQLTGAQLTHRISTCDLQKLLELNWDVLPHPPYSHDLAPSDFHLFRSLQNFLGGKNFSGREDIRLTLTFFEQGILNLPKRWEKFVEQNGQYVID